MLFRSDLAKHGLAGGDVFPPGTSEIVVESDQPFGPMKAGGYVDRRYVLRCTAVAPEFLFFIGQALLGVATAFTGAGVQHTVRGVSLAIRGDRSGTSDLDGETLRGWLARGESHPKAFSKSPPFELSVRPGEASITIQTKGKTDAARVEATLRAWLSLASLWRLRSGEAPVFGLSPWQTRSPDTFDFKGFALGAQRTVQAFPFELEAPLALLQNALAALHRDVPIAKVDLRIG